MLQCAGSLLLLELLAPDSSLSIMLIRVRLTAVKESPLLVFHLILQLPSSCDGLISTPHAHLQTFLFLP